MSISYYTMTVKQGLEIQARHMRQWKSLLSKSAYLALAQRVEEENKKPYKTGYDVFRGQDLDEVIHNDIMKKD